MPESISQGQHNYYSMTDYTLIMDIQEYIEDELHDSRYYALLAEKAPTSYARDMLMEFSREEQAHAGLFMRAYYLLTGSEYHLKIHKDPIVPDYIQALRDGIIAETTDYKKYGEQLQKVKSPYLQELFYKLRTEEAQLAMRMPLLLEDVQKLQEFC